MTSSTKEPPVGCMPVRFSCLSFASSLHSAGTTSAVAIDGKTYRSDEVTFAHTGSRNPDFARGYVQRYPVGRTVTVFYDPANPGFSVLEPESTEFYLILFFLPVALF